MKPGVERLETLDGELVREILEGERPLLDLYDKLRQEATQEPHKAIIEQILEQRRFQLNCLAFLETRLPAEFKCLGIVTEMEVNVRKGPSGRTQLLTKVDKGTALIVMDYQGNWVHVQLSDGTVGYIFKAYVRCVSV